MRHLVVGLTIALLSAFTFLGCGSGGGGGCAGDAECGTGKVCVDQACLVKACSGPADCFENQTCVAVEAAQGKVCTRVDCGLGTEDPDCALKAAADGKQYHCELGACLVTAVVDQDVTQEGIGPEVTDEVEPDTQGEAQGDDTVNPGDGKLCSKCVKDEDCGGNGNMCTPLPEGDFCTTHCVDNDGCPSGYLCVQVTTPENKQCVPGLYNECAECLITPCQDGQYCDQGAGQCKPKAGECQPCVKDDECGLGARCLTFAPGVKKCIPECGEGDACPEKSSCKALTGQQGTANVKTCVPNGAECCFGPTCAECQCATTNPALPHCDPLGNCVACTADEHCTQGQTCQSYQCQSQQCSDPEKPILWGGQCVQCTNDTHCSAKPLTPKCDLGSHLCAEGIVCPCVDPLPVCLTVNSQVMCVECDSDDDCKQGCHCDGSQHTCLGADGTTSCSTGVDACAQSGQDCTVNPCEEDPFFGNIPSCDAPTGCCYGTFMIGSNCDNNTMFCVVPGSECKINAFGLGQCSCTPDIMCIFSPVTSLGTPCINCAGGGICQDPTGSTTPTGNPDGLCSYFTLP
jgi:hypothetical protein